MYSLFGSKWCKLHRGPGWPYEATEQGARPFIEDLSPLAVSFVMLDLTARICKPMDIADSNLSLFLGQSECSLTK